MIPSPPGSFAFGDQTHQFEGLFETVREGWAIGWVWMPAHPERHLSVEILADATPVAAGIAQLRRGDVALGGRGDGSYGFRIALPATAGGAISARIANTQFRLPSSVGQIAPQPRLTGMIDHAVGLTAKGWCWHEDAPGQAVTLFARLDGEIIASAKADEFRGDLAECGIGDGHHSFTLHLPIKLGDGIKRLVTIETDTGEALLGSPIAIQTLAQGPLVVLDELVESLRGLATPAMQKPLLLLASYLGQVQELLPHSLPWRDYAAWREAQRGPTRPDPFGMDPGSLTMIDGDCAILLDQGAKALPGAIARALEIFRATDADLLYGDAEIDTPQGVMPWFRPDWSYDLFLAQDYLRGLVLIRAHLIGGAPPSLAAAKVMAIEAARPGRILHLPEILARLETPPQDDGDWLAAIHGHLTRRGGGAAVAPLDRPGLRRIFWASPDPAPLISLIIPTRDRVDLLRVAVSSIRARSSGTHFELIIVNNQSRDAETLRFLAEGQQAGNFRVIDYDAPFNFSAMNNEAAKIARGAILGFINNDVELITPDWLEQACGYMARSEIGALGVRLLFPNGMIQHGGVVLGTGGMAENAFQHIHGGDDGYFHRSVVAGNYSAVTAACLFVRRELFLTVGGFDAANLPVAFNDVDLCLRLRERGFLIAWTPHITLIHHESVSRGRDASPDRQARAFKEESYMRQRWQGVLLRDPYYSPNLNLDRRPFTALALPPRHRWGGSLAGRT